MMRIDLSKTDESRCASHGHHGTRTESKAQKSDTTQDQKLLRVGEDLSKVWIKWDTAHKAVDQAHMEAVPEQWMARDEDDDDEDDDEDEGNAGWKLTGATPNDTLVMCNVHNIGFDEESDAGNCGQKLEEDPI